MYTLRVVPAPEIRICEPFGSFEVYKDFTVASSSKTKRSSSSSTSTSTSSKQTPSSVGVAGIVVQCVEKTTVVKDANNTVYNTTAAVNTLTSGKVPYSNHKYLEYFPVEGAKTIDADSFSTGPLVQYDQIGPQTYTTGDDEYNIYKTEGKIIMVGENWFISANNKEYSDLLAMSWIVETKDNPNPANGLNYMPYSQDAYDRLKNCISSNILTHTVVAEWTFADPYTVVTSSISCRLKASIISTKKADFPKSPTPTSTSKSKGRKKSKSKPISSTKKGGRHHRYRYTNRHIKTKKIKMKNNNKIK